MNVSKRCGYYDTIDGVLSLLWAMRSTWDCLLENVGEWYGSFATVDDQGQLLSDRPSITSITPLEGGKTIYQRVRQFAPTADGQFPEIETAAPVQDLELTYSNLGRGFLALETGAFSQGSMQLGPFSEFGAELGLVARPLRVRVVIRYDKAAQLMPLSLIRETLDPMPTLPPGEPLTPEALLTALPGVWQGQWVTVYPDFQPAQTGMSHLEVRRSGDRLVQTLKFGNQAIGSDAAIVGNRLEFRAGNSTVLLLPNGISATFPTQLNYRQPLFLEAGWLINPNLRQRLIRSYDAQGAWASLTLVTEERVA
ncbi:MAG: DUF3598 family protein [Limnothrix sp.]|nr:DUF3598 family protein [Limnothrix sp. FACHB-708]MEB3117816.1 DUF3598 family protein [Limnothrix sp.]